MWGPGRAFLLTSLVHHVHVALRELPISIKILQQGALNVHVALRAGATNVNKTLQPGASFVNIALHAGATNVSTA